MPASAGMTAERLRIEKDLELRREPLQAHDLHELAHFALLLLAEHHDQRDRGVLELLHLDALAVERGELASGLVHLVGEAAQRRLDRRPVALLVWGELEARLDGGNLGV